MFLRAAALPAIDGTDALLAEARAAVERIAGALPDMAMPNPASAANARAFSSPMQVPVPSPPAASAWVRQ